MVSTPALAAVIVVHHDLATFHAEVVEAFQHGKVRPKLDLGLDFFLPHPPSALTLSQFHTKPREWNEGRPPGTTHYTSLEPLGLLSNPALLVYIWGGCQRGWQWQHHDPGSTTWPAEAGVAPFL